MSVTALALPAPVVPTIHPPVIHPPACLRAVARRASVNLAIGCVVPAVVFYTVVCVSGVWTAIAAALGWSYGTLVLRALTGGRTSGLLVLTTTVLTGRTALALLADSPFLYFLQPIVTDTLIAAAFLWSLRTARPMVARLAGDFYPIDAELAARPRVEQLFRRLTLLWATLWLGKAALGLWLLLSQPLETYVLVKGLAVLVINLVALASTLAAAAYVGRREGLIGRAKAA